MISSTHRSGIADVSAPNVCEQTWGEACWRGRLLGPRSITTDFVSRSNTCFVTKYLARSMLTTLPICSGYVEQAAALVRRNQSLGQSARHKVGGAHSNVDDRVTFVWRRPECRRTLRQPGIGHHHIKWPLNRSNIGDTKGQAVRKEACRRYLRDEAANATCLLSKPRLGRRPGQCPTGPCDQCTLAQKAQSGCAVAELELALRQDNRTQIARFVQLRLGDEPLLPQPKIDIQQTCQHPVSADQTVLDAPENKRPPLELSPAGAGLAQYRLLTLKRKSGRPISHTVSPCARHAILNLPMHPACDPTWSSGPHSGASCETPHCCK